MSNVALVLCGGMGTRFAPISTKPKILADIGGKKYIDWLIDYLISHKFDKIVFSLGHKSELIVSHIKEINSEIPLEYFVEHEPLGTGGAIRLYFEKYCSDEVYVFNGDTYFTEKLPNELFAKVTPNTCIVICKNFDFNDRYGDFSIVDGELLIKRGTQDAPIINSLVYCGVARVPRLIKLPETYIKFSTEQLFLTQNYKFKILSFEGNFVDFGVPEAYRRLKYKEKDD